MTDTQNPHTLELRHVDIGVPAGGNKSDGAVTVCHDVNLVVPAGEIHVLFGPNGSGKSSLLSAIMGIPPFEVTSGEIWFGGQRIDRLPIDERARLGLGMSFQRPPSLSGVSVRHLAEALDATTSLGAEATALDLADFVDRDINSGFSGGEIKRWEILKLFLQQPYLCLFDEPESGVDLEHIAAVADAISRLVRPSSGERSRSALIITHTGFVLDYITSDVGHLLIDGRIVDSGDASTMFAHIKRHGYRPPTTV